jgi:hypothetical protein
MTVGVPAPYLREGELKFQAGAKITIDKFFGGINLNPSVGYKCAWTTGATDANCSFSASEEAAALRSADYPKLELLRTDYDEFGKYESFSPQANKGEKSFAESVASSPESNVDQTIVSNVFAGAEPTILPVGENGKLMLWVRQNPALPVLQSTEIAWSYFDGANWSQPAVVAADNRAEFSPAAAVDSNGNVVAAWLRIKEPAFNTPIQTVDDLPLFYKQAEVVSAVFNPATRTWSNVAALTDDLAFDTGLRLSSDASGNLLLTWQSNPSGEFTATAAAPATIKYSFWNGSNWNASQAIAGNLTNISEHSTAINGNNAFLVVPRDQDPATPNNEVLLAYSWNGSNWSQAATFAAGNADNQLPQAYYDQTGQSRVIWRRGADLVAANLNNPNPTVVRQGSDSLGFSSLRLVKSWRGNLALIWQEMVDNGPANIFATTYNPNSQTWSRDTRLNQDSKQSSNAAGYYDNAGKLNLVYLATQIQRVTRTVTINGQSVEIPNVPENGQTDIRLISVPFNNTTYDFDGDGKADLSVYRPSNGVWYLLQSQSGFAAAQFGISTDKLAPADFDGDGKTDIAVWRDNNPNVEQRAYFYVLQSSNGQFRVHQFGKDGDVPIPGDFDGDGKADLAVYRNGGNGAQSYFYYRPSTQPELDFVTIPFGLGGDKPVAADYDGDGKTDVAVFRPANGVWYLLRSRDGFGAVQFGIATDKPVVSDYDGDGRADPAVYRDGFWYLLRSRDGFTGAPFGLATDVPAPADYDGDGKTDLAVYRSGNWYLLQTTSGFAAGPFGISTDKPVPNAFVP